MSPKKSYWILVPLLIGLIFCLTACGYPTPTGPTPTPNPVYFPGCSEDNLVGHIDQANTKPGPDVIYLDPYCVYTLEQVKNTAVVDNVTINNGLPPIMEDLTIQGNNAVIEIVPAVGEDNFGHFYVEPLIELALYDLTLRGGIRPIGGAVVIEDGVFFASHVLFENNEAQHEDQLPSMGGAIYNQGGSVSVINGTNFEGNRAGEGVVSSPGQGGAIFSNNGTLEVYHTTFAENIAAGNGGAIYSSKEQSNPDGGLVTISDSYFSENQAWQNGGSIALIDEIEGVFIASTDFADNWAVDSGGAIYSRGTDLGGLKNEFFQNHAVNGGAVYTMLGGEGSQSNYRSESTRFDRNRALIGGAIFSENSDVILQSGDFYDNYAKSCGAFRHGGSPTLDIRAESINVRPVSSITKIIDSFFYRNIATVSHGGAVCHLMGDVTIRGTRFSSNQAAEFGGALLISDEIEISDMIMALNTASNGAGVAIGYPWSGGTWISPAHMNFGTSISESNIWGNQASNQGGGIWMSNGGRVSIDHSLLQNNSSLSEGGGIYQLTGGLYISNSTFSGNTAYNGGGLYNDGTKDSLILEIRHSTFANNIATEDPTGGAALDRLGGGGLNLGGIVNIYNSLVTKNSNKDCDLNQTMTYTKSGNVDFDGTCGFSITETDPRIGPLKYNGGNHATIALLPDSPLINILPDCATLSDDQRGVPRPQESYCDPGAYEFDPEDPFITPPPPPPPMPDNPPDDSSDNCPPFEDLDISVVLLNVPTDTLVLPLYFKFLEGVPGQDEAEPWKFRAELGNKESNKCDQQGFNDRLYCMFNLTPDEPGLALDLLLYKDDCEDPSYTLLKVTIPELEGSISIPDPILHCSKDLNKDACEAAGGAMSSGVSEAPYCICP